MRRCRTELDQNALKALTKYHVNHTLEIRRKKNLFYFLGVILVALSIWNAYTSWKQYAGTESLFTIFAMPFVFAALSIAVFWTAQKGMEGRLYRELKKYFAKTDITHLDYIITEEEIRINVKGKPVAFKWEIIDNFESDDKYHYFSCQGKYNIISKESISSKNQALLEEYIKNMNQSK